MAEELTLSIDPTTGEYTRLTRFLPGADTAANAGRTHPYPEGVFIVSGRLYDQAFQLWLEAGHLREPSSGRTPRTIQDGCRLHRVGGVIPQSSRCQ